MLLLVIQVLENQHLASAFLNRGYQLLSDDVIAVSLSQEESIPFVTPSYPQQKLWQESSK